MPATATIDDPEVIEDELSDLKDRRDQLCEKRKEVEAVLEKAHNRLKGADSEEEQNEALDDAHELQVRRDTLQDAEKEVQADIAELEQRLDEAKAAQREEERLEALAEKGRAAVEAREENECRGRSPESGADEEGEGNGDEEEEKSHNERLRESILGTDVGSD